MESKMKRLWSFWWVLILLIAAPALIKATLPDPDTFFLMTTGRYIVENGIVPTINPFVIHEGFQIVVQQWLFDVIVYGSYSALGNMGLFLFVSGAYTISLILLYKYFGLFTKNNLAKGLMMLVVGLLYTTYGVARPTCISLPVMVALLYSLEKYRQTNKRRYLIVLPILSLIEINIHSAMWPMMFVLMMPYVFPLTLIRKGDLKENARKWFERNKLVILAMLAMFAAGFLNPNGIPGMTYVMNSYGSATGGIAIAELLPPNTDTVQGLTIIVSVAFLAIYVYRNKHKFSDEDYDMQTELTRLSLMAGVLVLACMHYRNTWYLYLGATPVMLEMINNIKIKIKKPKWLTPFRQIELTIMGLALTGFIAYFAFSVSTYSSYTSKDNQMAPYAAADYLDQIENEEIQLFTEFNNGAFMEWRGYKVYMDARPELFQAKVNGREDVYSEYGKVHNGKIDYEAFLAKYKFTHLIVTENTVFDMYLKLNEKYEAVVDGNGYKLYEYVQS